MLRMETNMLGRTEPDRIMWFSMWFLASIATFGLAFFPMFYYSVERRNKHFSQEEELEKRALAFFRDEGKELPLTPRIVPERNAKLWTASIVLVIPVFAIAYFLSEDLLLHEKSQQAFLAGLFPEIGFMTQTIAVRKYALITLLTLGVGVVYWFYKILNIYNAHFKDQRRIEEEINRLMEKMSHGKSV